MIEKPNHLEPAIMAPLDPTAVPEAAFECSSQEGCGERLSWNPETQKLECWNPECKLYAGRVTGDE